jgi:hypothetical protein
VQGGIQLAVATAWQPMAFGAAGADRDRGHSVVHGKQASERNRATPAVSARPDWADKADHIVRERITAVDPGYNGYGCTSGSDDLTIAGALKRLELPDRLLVVRSASDFKDSGPEPAPEPCMTCLHSPGAFGGHSIYRETPAASHGSSHTLCPDIALPCHALGWPGCGSRLDSRQRRTQARR